MRARNIKPGLFKNEILGQCDPIYSLLFAGLWCLADREGKLEDRPLRIKGELFPYRGSLDINRYLTDLQRWGFIVRYGSGDVNIIKIVNFSVHQSPHHTERRSMLQDPDSADSCRLTVSSPLTDGGNPPDSLIPDSLIPDSSTTPSACAQLSLLTIPQEMPLKEKQNKAKPEKPTKVAGPRIDEILSGTPEGEKLGEWFWLTAGAFPKDKNHKPREAAMLYRAIYDGAEGEKKEYMKTVYRGAIAYRDTHLPPNRKEDETRYMTGFLGWLEQQGWESALREGA